MRRFLSPLHLVRLVTLLVLLTASIGMTGSHAAMAVPAPAAMEHSAMAQGAMKQGPLEQLEPAAMSHCRDMQKGQHDQSSADIDCMIACSGLPATLASHDVAPALRPMPHYLPLASALEGLDLKADTPPPRSFDA